jgi:hypothetical protein
MSKQQYTNIKSLVHWITMYYPVYALFKHLLEVQPLISVYQRIILLNDQKIILTYTCLTK